MNKRPGHVVVTTEVAVCSFCGRPRTLRKEEHQLGALVRTIVTCETCHRTLSSSIGVASPEAKVEATPAAATVAAEPKPAAVKPAAAPKAKPAATKAKAPANKTRRAK